MLKNARRKELEALYVAVRVAELKIDPVVGNFDVAHLREVNRRIFQDLPGTGFKDVTPGEFRESTPDGYDWVKDRGLSTQKGLFCVAYSRMDEAAKARLDRALEEAKPDKLRRLKTPEFTAKIASIYVELDYIHPFSDGNSRTLRAFTKQLAKESGYEINWERFNRSAAGRDVLCIARDLSVNELAKPHLQDKDTLREITYTQDRLEGNLKLPDLLRYVVRPSRAVAFERMTEQKALKMDPELQEAFKTMRMAADYFILKIPGKPEAQEVAIQSVKDHVQLRLNSGEVSGFSQDCEQGELSARGA